MIQVKSATKDGFEIANEGDSINFSVPNSKTRRGRVGVVQTLDTACNQGIISGSQRAGNKGEGFRESKGDCLPTLTTKNDESTSGTICIVNINLSGEKFENEHAGTIRAGASSNYQLVNNIRRLTEIECERLQGFPDNHTEFGIYERQVWINKKEKTFEIVFQKHKIPRTQRYKLCGNAITRTMAEVIGIKLLKL